MGASALGGGLESTMGLPQGPAGSHVLHPLVEVALPHVMVQVMTLWAQGPQDMSGLCWHCALVIGGAEGSATRGHGGRLRESFVHSEPMNQLIKEKVGLPRARTGGGGKERHWLGFR